MASKIKIYRGDTFTGIINLRKVDAADKQRENPFPIISGSTVEVLFPGTPSVVLSTVNVGEITINDANLSTFTYVGSPAKSLLMDLGDNQTLTVVVTSPSNEVTTFEQSKILTIVDRANE